MPDPQLDLATHIATNVAAFTLGTNCFEGPVRPVEGTIPALAVFCFEFGGEEPQEYNGGAGRTRKPQVIIRVRGNRKQVATGKTQADLIMRAVHTATISGYYNALIIESAPMYIGEDKAGHPEWSMTAELWYEEA